MGKKKKGDANPPVPPVKPVEPAPEPPSAAVMAAAETSTSEPAVHGPDVSDGAFETAVRGVLGLLLFALPVAWFPPCFDLYDGVKRVVAHVVVVLALLLWAASGPARGVLQMRASRLAAALLALLGFQALSLATAINPVEGLTELANRVLWLAALLLGVQVVGRRTHLNVLTGFGLAGATCASLVGIAQAAGWTSGLLPQVAIPAAVFGNKNMAAEYVLIWMPIGIYAMLAWPSSARRALGGAAFGITSSYVFLAGTRATYVAVVAAGALMALGLIEMLRDPAPGDDVPSLRRRMLAGLVTVLVTWVLVWLSLEAVHLCLEPGRRRNPLSEATSAMTLSTFSSNWRLVVWTNTLAMIKDHPVLGVGLGNWRIHYPRYHRRIAVDTDFNSHVQADTPHNDWVQLFAETGLIGLAGLAVFLLALAFAFTGWLTGHRDHGPPRALDERLALLAILMMTIAYGVDAVFSFPMAKAAPTFALFVMLGAAEGLAGARRVIEIRGHAASACAQAAATLALGVLAGQAAWTAGDLNFKAGLELYNQGRILESNERLAQAYRFRPFDPSLAVFHGGIANELGHTDESMAINLRARNQHPNFTNVLNQLGNLHWKKGQSKEAEDAYKEVLAIHPDFMEALRNLASLYISTGRLELARPLLEHLVTIDKSDATHQLDLGEVYRALKKRERSREMLSALVKNHPENPRALMALAHLSREEKKLDDAERLYRRALQVAPGTPPRYFLATLLSERGRADEARALLEAALKAEPKNKLVTDALAKLDGAGPLRSPTADIPRVLDATESSLRERLAMNPRSAPLHHDLAEYYLVKGNFGGAIEELRRTVEADARIALAWAKLAKLAQRSGRTDEAERLLREGLKASPADFTLWNELGLIHQGRGDAPHALEAFEHAAAAPGAPPEIWFNVGAQRGLAGRTDDAIDALNRFLAGWKGDPGVRKQAETEIARLQALKKK